MTTPPVAKVAATALVAASVMAGEVLDRSRRIVPSPLPVLTATVRVAPVPVMVPTDAPVTPVVVRLKLPAATPVTDSEKVTVKLTDDAPVSVAAGTIEVTVGAVVSMTMALFVPSEPAAARPGSVSVAAFAPLAIVPPLSASEFVAA